MIISVCGLIGYETAKQLSERNREIVLHRFAPFFIRQFEALEEELAFGEPSSDETQILYSCDIREGGLFRALWEACEALGCGMKAALRAIPVRQEVVEILELFGETPYECSSFGAKLVITEKKTDKISFPGKESAAYMIGITTENAARVIEDGDSVRFLTPPIRQEKDIKIRESSGGRKVFDC